MADTKLTHVDVAVAQRPTAPNARLTRLGVVVAESASAPVNVRLTRLDAVVAVPNLAAGNLPQVGLTSRLAPAMLLDILTVNGNTYFWASHEIDWDQFQPPSGDDPLSFHHQFPALLADGPVSYQPYIVSAGPFTLTRSLRTDGGEIVVQNLSGNTVERDVLKALRADEFEGALAIFRVWDFITGTRFEFHGTLRLQSALPTQISFQLTQLLDATLQDIPQRAYSDRCTWIYKTDVCGSTGTAESCPKSAPACKDPRRAAFHRFNGIVSGPQITEISSIQYQQQIPVSFQKTRKVNR